MAKILVGKYLSRKGKIKKKCHRRSISRSCEIDIFTIYIQLLWVCQFVWVQKFIKAPMIHKKILKRGKIILVKKRKIIVVVKLFFFTHLFTLSGKAGVILILHVCIIILAEVFINLCLLSVCIQMPFSSPVNETISHKQRVSVKLRLTKLMTFQPTWPIRAKS